MYHSKCFWFVILSLRNVTNVFTHLWKYTKLRQWWTDWSEWSLHHVFGFEQMTNRTNKTMSILFLKPSVALKDYYCKGVENELRDGEKGEKNVSSGAVTCLAPRNWSKETVGKRVGEWDGGDGESPAMSSLTVHWAAHVSKLHPSGSDSHTHTGVEPPNGLLHSPFSHDPRLPACTANAPKLPLVNKLCLCYSSCTREGSVYKAFRKGL